MFIEFNSATLQKNSKQVKSWTIDEENIDELDNGNFTCGVSSQGAFARLDEIRACPITEPNATCLNESSYTNYSAVMPGSELKSLLLNLTHIVQLDCWALNPYLRTPFPNVAPSSWPVRMIPRTTTTGFLPPCSPFSPSSLLSFLFRICIDIENGLQITPGILLGGDVLRSH